MDPSHREHPTARCIVLTGYGDYEKVRVEDLPVTPPEAGEVQVKVEACGLNFADIYTRLGLFPGSPKPPCVLGMECAGSITAIGDNVQGFKIGNRVICHGPDGGMYRTLVSVPVTCCYKMPDSMSYQEGAALLVNYVTAHLALFGFGHLQRAGTVFVHSVGGGVGWAVTQLAKTVPEVQVLGTSSASKHQTVLANGVDKVFTYEKFKEEIAVCCPKGVDIFIDNQSGSDFSQALQYVGTMGKLIHIGAMNAVPGSSRNILALLRTWWGLKDISVLKLVNCSAAVCGLNISTVQRSNPHHIRDAMEAILSLYEIGAIKPKIDSVWSFEQITEAAKRMANRQNTGKIILVPTLHEDNEDSKVPK